MKITFLGTAAGMTEKGAFCSGAVVSVGNAHYVIDAGAPLATLLQNYDIPFADIRAVFITHPHHDHFLGLVGLSDLIEGYGTYADLRLPVYHPAGVPIGKMYDFLWDGVYEKQKGERLIYREFPDAPDGGAVIFDDGILRVTAFPVEPSVPHSHAFLLEGEGRRVFFSGDLHKDYTDYPAILETAEVPFDLVVVESAHSVLTGEPVMAHLLKTRTKRLIVQHRNKNRNTDGMMADLRRDLSALYEVTTIGDGYTVEI